MSQECPAPLDETKKRTAAKKIVLPKRFLADLLGVCLKALPGKAYGLVGGRDYYRPESVYPCTTNLRNTPEWKSFFESFGDFYRDSSRGFVISPDEYMTTVKQIAARGESFVGVYHSHRCTHAEPSALDLALHLDRDLFCYIVSVTEPAKPVVRVYRMEEASYEEILYEAVGPSTVPLDDLEDSASHIE